jgi:hypothetical protein
MVCCFAESAFRPLAFHLGDGLLDELRGYGSLLYIEDKKTPVPLDENTGVWKGFERG